MKGSGISPSLHWAGAATLHGVLMEGSLQFCLLSGRAHKSDFWVNSTLEYLINFHSDLPYLGKPIDYRVQGVFWYWEGYRSGFCEKLPGDYPMSRTANASQLQDGPTAGQCWANQE
ncbi:hypothetical protein WISP_129840 [Willisornis vidua]|uniref:Uncharacterized protein n=1 Tax=Willisornis vidua TaxID=1566151 RepID=A0ABQ9CUZ4_9PASS|nr:hypothetical protein WISP_129840 [Willisornis vidua]